MNDSDKAASRRIPLEAFNKGKLETIDEVVSPSFTDHQPMPPGMPSGIEGIKSMITELRKAFPDFKYRIDKEISEGDTMVQYMTASGTMKGDFLGMKATGKHAEWQEVHIVRMENGMGAEHWGVVDAFSMLQQLGFIPSPGEMAKAA
jgi:predicted ester cyclase